MNTNSLTLNNIGLSAQGLLLKKKKKNLVHVVVLFYLIFLPFDTAENVLREKECNYRMSLKCSIL